MSQSCVMSLVSANLMRGSLFLCSSKSKLLSTRLVAVANSVSFASKPVRDFVIVTKNYASKFGCVNQTGPPEIQFPGGTPSEELPSQPNTKPDWAPLEVPELPRIPEINPSETPPEVTTSPNDPPPLGAPKSPGPEFPLPPSPSPPMPDTPNTPSPRSPPDVVPPNWDPPRSPDIVPPEIPTPGIDPPIGPTVI